MNKILFLSLIIFAISSSSKNLILIGDSRYVGMAAYLIGIPYDYTNIRTTSPKSYAGVQPKYQHLILLMLKVLIFINQ